MGEVDENDIDYLQQQVDDLLGRIRHLERLLYQVVTAHTCLGMGTGDFDKTTTLKDHLLVSCPVGAMRFPNSADDTKAAEEDYKPPTWP